MTSPTLSARMILNLATSHFVEAAAQQGGLILDPTEPSPDASHGVELWARIKQHFVGHRQAEGAIAKIEADPLTSALSQLETYLDEALAQPKNKALAQDLAALAQPLITPPPSKRPRRPRPSAAQPAPAALPSISPTERKEIWQEAQDLCAE